MKTIEIKLQSQSEELGKYISSTIVEQVAQNIFRMICNDLLIRELTFGTEFETKVNDEGLHEIVKIVKKSPFITKRYMLTSKYNQSDYRVIGDEIKKYGGNWQVDFGSIASVNIPPNYLEEYETLIQSLNLKFMETQ